ncbi:zinc transporter foi [Diachasma alloeum]|uniref:zinc transporter foi n=1 Tax=Diachasma alloeum TaxID=454923 RepID=UPI0007381C23|nr:zinc transporter foi [Diachasma alloeum]XP_015116642.1 zinc transporter foi [Diachasma alloeum]
MSQHFMTVCVVCVLCASHNPCSAHTTMSPNPQSYQDPVLTPSPKYLRINSNNDPRNHHEMMTPPVEDRGGSHVLSPHRSKKLLHSEKMKLRFEKQEVPVPREIDQLESREVLQRLGHIPEEIPFKREKHSMNQEKGSKIRQERHVEIQDNYYLKKIFDTFGDGESLSMEGFENMLRKLGLTELIRSVERDESRVGINGTSRSDENSSKKSGDPNSINAKEQCLSTRDFLTHLSPPPHPPNVSNLTQDLFSRACPILLYHLTSSSPLENSGCISIPTMTQIPLNPYPEEFDDEPARNIVQVWVYSTISIIIISLCGLLGVAVIPVMGKSYYNQLLQFLVALAIGTLCGDALIHLLPHAMMSSHSHELGAIPQEIDHETLHNSNMWKGLTAMMGLILFFFTEKALSIVAEWRKYRQRRNKPPSRVRVMRESEGPSTVGEKLCKHKYSSYPYCYGEITTKDNHHEHEHNDKERSGGEEVKPLNEVSSNSVGKDEAGKKEEWKVEEAGRKGEEEGAEGDGYTVIIREHENKHHGHTHSHGHVHAAPESMSSVAWMVIMGDGLHNFTDGMAIGAAFAANIAGGFSTAIAVFCHELPHELGDFAVLLKAGMSAKQAVFYNLLSSVLCLFGMIFGVLLGAQPATTSWVFAAAAGMFIYIALVDMIPELSSGHTAEGGSNWQCILQGLGLLTGLGIMLVIALYEHDLQHIFSD